jgi:hypothetical protein
LSAARAHVRCESPDFLTIYPIGAAAGEPAFTAVYARAGHVGARVAHVRC